MTLKPPRETFVRTDAELTQLWEHMMGSGGFARHSIWHIFFDADGQMCPVIIPIDDIPLEPDPNVLDNLADIVGEITRASAIASVAVLFSRPGEQAMTAADRRWARAIHAAFASTIRLWPVHLATTDRIQIFAPDDLIAA